MYILVVRWVSTIYICDCMCKVEFISPVARYEPQQKRNNCVTLTILLHADFLSHTKET